MSDPQTSRRMLALTLVVLLVGFALRVYRLPAQSLWYDEALSVYYAAQPLPELLAGVSGSDHPPLHSLLLHFWMALAGRSEFAVRYLSLWWGVLGVALLYRLGQQLFDKPSGLLAAALLAVSPFHVWYSQEARMYSLALVLSLGVVWALVAIVARRRASAWLWMRYVLLGTLALYAHFYTSFVLLFVNLAFGAWWLVRAVRGRWRTTRGILLHWATAQAGVLALFLPWGRFVAEQYATNATYWRGVLGLKQIITDTALAFAAGDGVRTLPSQAGAMALIAMALLGVQAAAQSGSDPAKRGLSRGERALWLLLWLIVPVVALFAVSHDRPKFAPRYLLPALPASLLLAAAGAVCLASLTGERSRPALAQRLKRWLATVGLLLAGALIVGTVVVSLQRQYFDEALARPDFRAAAAYVKDHALPGDAVVLVGGHSYPAFDYYFGNDLPVHPLPPGLLPSTEQPLDYGVVTHVAEIAADRDRLWLLLWQDRLVDPTEIILNHLLRTCPRLDVGRGFHGMALLLFSVADCDLGSQAGPSSPLRVEFDGQVRLLGYDLTPATVAPGETLHLALYWEAMDKVAVNYTTLAHLLGPDGQIYAQHDRITGDDAYPTSHWQIGTVISNDHALTVSPDASPGLYRLIVGLYVNEGDLPRLRITNPAGVADDAFVVAEVKVEAQSR